MIDRRIIAALVIALLVGVGAGFGLAKWTPSQNGVAAASGGRKVLYWRDPMTPNVRFDKPGKSPYMDMQLVPVYADEAGAGAAVKVDPTVSQNLGIRLGKVERAEVSPQLSAVGSVSFDEGLVNVVQARADGYVRRLWVRAPLQRVHRGEPLADVVAPEWRAAQEEFAALRGVEGERAKEIRAAARDRLIALGIPEETIRALDAGRAPGAATTIYSPADGVVAELGAREGAAFASGSTLFRINGLSRVWATAQVPESQVSLIPIQARVNVQATAWPAEVFTGQVLALLPDIDERARTMPVRIGIDNRAGKLAPGMFVSLDFAAAHGKSELLVPSEAVIVTGERTAVIVARDGGGFDVANVKTGAESGGKTVIKEGLHEGESVVLSGQFLIDSEASLKSAISRLTPVADGAAP